jgi:hypothetical protein
MALGVGSCLFITLSIGAVCVKAGWFGEDPQVLMQQELRQQQFASIIGPLTTISFTWGSDSNVPIAAVPWARMSI